jgi:hypothetical protein
MLLANLWSLMMSLMKRRPSAIWSSLMKKVSLTRRCSSHTQSVPKESPEPEMKDSDAGVFTIGASSQKLVALADQLKVELLEYPQFWFDMWENHVFFF